jgi:hypothetical protein
LTKIWEKDKKKMVILRALEQCGPRAGDQTITRGARAREEVRSMALIRSIRETGRKGLADRCIRRVTGRVYKPDEKTGENLTRGCTCTEGEATGARGF